MQTKDTDLNYYARLAGSGKPGGGRWTHTPELWNKRAVTWDAELREEGSSKKRSDIRVAETARFLREQGALNSDTHLIDIGCGLGLFVTEFGKTAADSLGVDFSEEMVRRGRAYAAEQGVANARFEVCDFLHADLDERGWKNAFDLVFASITPAVKGPEGWRKMIEMSRKYCCISMFVYASVPLEDEIEQTLFGGVETRRPNKDGRSLYALFNTLWLWGYFPTITYFREVADESLRPDHTLAVKLDERFNGVATDAGTSQMYDYLKSICGPDGMYHYFGEWIYARVLWDVRKRIPRDYD